MWDKQQRTHKGQNEETKICKILKFGVVWAYIERDTAVKKNSKIYQDTMDSVSSNPLSLSKFFKFLTSVSCSILTWLIPNLRILQNSMFFSSLCGPRVVYPIINRLIPSPPQFEIRQCHDYNYNRLSVISKFWLLR